MFSSKLENSIRILKRSFKKRRASLDKILISKPEFKHTNDKVTITLYVYNRELSVLKSKVNRIKKVLLAKYFFKVFSNNTLTIQKLEMAKQFANKAFGLRNKIRLLLNKENSFSNKKINFLRRINLAFKRLKRNLIDINTSVIKSKVRSNKNLSYLKLNNQKYKELWFTNRRIKRKVNPFIRRFKKFVLNRSRIINSKSYKDLIAKLYKDLQYFRFLSSLMKQRGVLHIGRSLSNFNNKLNKLEPKISINSTKSKFSNNISKIKILNKSLILTYHISSMMSKTIKENNILDKYLKTPVFKHVNITFLNTFKKIAGIFILYIRYNRNIQFNEFKFNIFILPLKVFLEKIYNKNVEFNIINIKSYHLNSSILTQVLSIKLRDRKNKLEKVVRNALSKVKLPITRKHEYTSKDTRNVMLQNILLKNMLNNHYLYKKPILNNSLFIKSLDQKRVNIKVNKLLNIVNNKDKLDLIIESIYPSTYILSKSNEINSLNTRYLIARNLENIVLNSISKKVVSGIRVEASGRLTKRITAAKSIFKIIQKGTIKDINSSYRKLPSMLLRGNLRSNTQFFKVNSKTRIGSFGLKGWISST